MPTGQQTLCGELDSKRGQLWTPLTSALKPLLSLSALFCVCCLSFPLFFFQVNFKKQQIFLWDIYTYLNLVVSPPLAPTLFLLTVPA